MRGGVIALFAAFVLFFGDDVMRLVYPGQHYQNYNLVLAILATWQLATAVSIPLYALSGMEYVRLNFWIGLTAAVLTTVCFGCWWRTGAPSALPGPWGHDTMPGTVDRISHAVCPATRMMERHFSKAFNRETKYTIHGTACAKQQDFSVRAPSELVSVPQLDGKASPCPVRAAATNRANP